MENTPIENKTREVFHKLHLAQLENEDSINRFRSLLNVDTLRLKKTYFNGKYCADIGCGSSVPGSTQLLDFGAEFVHVMDLDDSFKESARNILESKVSYNQRWQLDVGSLLSLPYRDKFFDFVLCHGVIHHVEDDQTALNEISRILKVGGKAYITVVGKGGMFNRLTMDLMREKYQSERSFREFVDVQLTTKWIQESIIWLESNMDKDTSNCYKKSKDFLGSLKTLLDDDFVLSLKDVLQAPIYHNYKEEEFENMLHEAGYTSWYRVAQKPHYNNIRRIVAPLYFDFKSGLSRLFYGDGYLNMVVTR